MSASDRGRWRLFAGAASLSAALLAPVVAFAGSPYLEVSSADEAVRSPAYRYANMTNEEAFAELDRRGVAYTRVAPIGSVRAPIRLGGRLHGVDIHSALPAPERAASMFEILDARLALALDDFCVILAQHDVVEAVHYTMYRPNVPAPGTQGVKSAPAATGGKPVAGGKDDPVATGDAGRAPEGTSKNSALKPKSKAMPAKRRAKLITASTGKSLDGKAAKLHKGGRRSNPSGQSTRKEGFERAELEDLPAAGEIGAKAPSSTTSRAAKAAPKAAGKTAPGKSAAATSSKSAKKLVVAKTAQPHGKWAPPGTRHPAGLAIDLGFLRKQDGSLLHVASHFDGKIGDATCGPTASRPNGEEARELREIVCAARDNGVFTYALTPNYDADHVDHFHLEIKPGVKWFLYH